MRVLVTGGCGFIGSHVVDCLLAGGHRVMAVDNFFSGCDHWLKAAARPEIRQIDITQRRPLSVAFQEWKPEVVFHLAAYPYIPFCEKDPVAAYDLNVVGTHNVLALSWNIAAERFFFASTADVYAPSSRAHREDDPTAPFTVYGQSKLLAESLCRGALNWGWNTNLGIGRIFSAVGRRESTPHPVPEIVRQIGERSQVHSPANLLLQQDFVDVNSLARAIVDWTFAVEDFEICNLGSGVAVTLQQMAETVGRAAGSPIEVVSDPANQTDTPRKSVCADTSRLRRSIGYAPKPADESTIRGMLAEMPSAAVAMGNGHRH